jgi:acyl-coenzyme A thioesterase PaaI-like protein
MAKRIVFEPEYVEAMRTLFEETIPFNRVLGLKIDAIRPGHVDGSLAMRPELIGSPNHQRLHGGVISACLDAMAGLAIIASIGARHMDEPPAQRMHRFARLGTIDLRIDYLPSARASRSPRRCCASARGSPRRGWSSATSPASCSPAAPRPTSCPRA